MADSQDAIELRRRARRRLVGAIALVVFMVIALPIVLDREPKPVSQELTIQIPSQDAGRFASRVAPPEPPPLAPAADGGAPAAGAPAAPVAVTPLAAPAEPAQARSDKSDKAEATPSARSAVGPFTADKPEAPRSEPAALKPRPEAALAPFAKSEKPAAAPAAKEVKPEPTKAEAPKADGAKAEASKAELAKAEVPKAEAPKSEAVYAVPLGLFSKPDNIKQVRGKASAAGIKTYTDALAGSDRIRVRAGPFATRDAAEKAREKLKAAGLDVGAVAAR